jgi:acetyl esterase
LRSTVGERAQYLAARLLARAPDRLKILLSGEPPIVVDGQHLDPQLQLLRSVRRRRGVIGLLDPTIAAERARYRRETHIFRGPITTVGAVGEFEIAGPAGTLRVRLYQPEAFRSSSLPLTVYLHGGGFVIGDLDTHDEPCRMLCHHAGVHVLSVSYGLAPEHPFPAAVDDSRATFQWARAHAASLGADPRRIAVGGDSAGANLAAVVAALESHDGTPPSAQLLIYPPSDVATPRRSHELFAAGFFLTLRDRDTFFHHYVDHTGVRADDPRLSPLCERDLANLPPALVVIAGFDVLRDESEAYADALAHAGCEVRVQRYPELGHGFIHTTGICCAAARAMKTIAREWHELVGHSDDQRRTR